MRTAFFSTLGVATTATTTITDSDEAFASISSASDPTATEDAATTVNTGLLTFSLKDDNAGTNPIVVDTDTEVTFTVAVSTDANNEAGALTQVDFKLQTFDGVNWNDLPLTSGTGTSSLTYTLTDSGKYQ